MVSNLSTVKNIEAIPAAMRARKQWVLWKYEIRNGKTTKPPFQLNGKMAKTNDPETWTDFDTAIGATGYDGLGYVFRDDGLVGIDLDHCILPEGNLADWAAELVDLFSGTYMERSPGGDGLHIICKGTAVETGSKKWKNDEGVQVGIEVYDHASPRYFTVTGNAFNEFNIESCQPQLQRVFDKYFQKAKKSTPAPVAQSYPESTPELDEVWSALQAISADEYKQWLNVGMALKAGGFGVDLWDRWSSKSSKYEAGECEKKWNTFNGAGRSIKTVFGLAADAGWKWIQPSSTHVTRIHSAVEETLPVEDPPAEQQSNVVPLKAKKSILSEAGQQKEQAQASSGGNTYSSHPQWIKQPIPYGYRLNQKGLYKCNPDPDKTSEDLFAGPIYVAAQTSNPRGADSGFVLEFINTDDQFQTITIPRSRMHEDANILSRELASLGFKIVSGKEKELLKYLSLSSPKERRTCATQTGWIEGNEAGRLVYIFPNSATQEGYHYQPERYSPSSHSVVAKGTLDQWLNEVFDPSPYPLFAVLASLSGAMLKFASMDSGGFHFFGGSSSGKTTLAQIAASIFGNGADPADATNNPYTKRWNTTLNALEGLAAAFNDLPLILDELGSCNAKDFGRAIYDLAGGQGKAAMDASRNLRAQRVWRNCIISTGEVSSQVKIEENLHGKRASAKAGQLIRLIDIEVNQQMFGSRAQVDKIKRACSRYYGTLGPALIKAVADKFDENQIRDIIEHNLDLALERLVKGKELNALQERALRRFAMAETTGHLLIHLKVIPKLSHDTVKAAIDQVVADWLPRSQGLSDSERAIASLSDYILRYRESKIKNLNEFSVKNEKIHHEIAGYYDSTAEIYYLLPEAFKDALNGAEPVIIAKVLKAKKLLSDGYRKSVLQDRVTVEGKQILVYGIKAELLGEDEQDAKTTN